MSNITSSSKVTFDYPLASLPYAQSQSQWSEETIAKPKPVLATKRSLRSLGFHPPYAPNDVAYLRYSSHTPDYHLYRFKGAHISSLSTPDTRYHTAVFELAGQRGHTAYAFDIEEDCWAQLTFRVPTFVTRCLARFVLVFPYPGETFI